jgi:threonine dehydrogenase-like Zn-dependent dehydrogenase
MAVVPGISEALVHRGTHAALIVAEPPRRPAAGEVSLRPLQLLMGSLDRRILRGEIPFAGRLGREGLFIVEEVGEGAAASLLGKRVVVDACVSCMTCDLCRGGHRHLCHARTAPGLFRADGYGATIVTAPSSSVIEVPASIPDDSALIAQSLAAALHAVRLAQVDARGLVTILGDGIIALLAAQVAARINPSTRVLGKHPDRFRLCERLGIKHRHVAEAGKRHDQHVVIDCTGDASADGLLLASQLASPRARIVVKAPPVPLASAASHRSAGVAACASLEASIIGAGAGQVREAINLLLSQKIDAGLILSRRFPLQRAPELLDALHDRRVLGCVIEMPRP